MKTIEDKIQEILAEHHECRWMDSSELENCLRRIATEQKAIDDAERDTAVYNLLQLKLDNEKKLWLDEACEWLEENLGYYNRNEVHIGKSYEQRVIDDFRKSKEEKI